MSTPTRPRAPRNAAQKDRLSVEHSATYVSRRRGPSIPRPPKVKRPKLPPMPDRARPFGVASAIAAGWAAVMGLIVVGVPVLLIWASAAHTNSSAGDATSLGADFWLASHHVGFTVDGARLGLLPLGLLVVPFLLLRLSSGWAARILRPSTLGDAGLLVLATSLIYGLVGGLVAVLAGRSSVQANPFEAMAWCTVVALVATGWTVLRTTGLVTAALELLPAMVRPILRPAIAGLLAVLGGGALVTAASLLIRGGDVLAVHRALDGGFVGGLAILLLCLLYLPNLVVWATAFCVGPGFAVGTGTSVTLAGVSSGPLPAFPLFAAIPSTGVPAAPTWLVLLVPLAGGVVSAVWTTRADPSLDPESTALRAGVAGACAGLALGVLAWLAGGPLAGGRMSTLGPSAWEVGALAALELGLVAAVVAWVIGWRAHRVIA